MQVCTTLYTALSSTYPYRQSFRGNCWDYDYGDVGFHELCECSWRGWALCRAVYRALMYALVFRGVCARSRQQWRGASWSSEHPSGNRRLRPDLASGCGPWPADVAVSDFRAMGYRTRVLVDAKRTNKHSGYVDTSKQPLHA